MSVTDRPLPPGSQLVSGPHPSKTSDPVVVSDLVTRGLRTIYHSGEGGE